MKKKHGFTLIEILLAVMIVGIIGIALAAVTTAALRESGVGRTRMILRNQLSIALRQLRQDIQRASAVAVSSGGYMLTLTFNNDKKSGPYTVPTQVMYSFTAGTENAPGSTPSDPCTVCIGGTIYRTVNTSTPEIWLANVKKISNGTDTYPSFGLVGKGTNDAQDSRVRVQLIVQSNSMPVVNEFVDETFFTSQGVGVCDPCLSNSCEGTCL